MKLKGRVALVTGSQRGLGLAIAEELASEGALSIINYPTEAESPAAHGVAQRIADRGGRAQALKADVSDLSSVQAMVRGIIDTHGRLDILVNNAGVNPLTSWEEIDRADWDRTIAVNLTGVFNCCQTVLKPMKQQRKGNIINISSIASFIGRGNADYIASKSALIGMTRSLARQYGKHGIRANAIAPGWHKTEMVKATLESNDRAEVEQMMKQIPLGFLPEPDSVGKAASFLASDDSYFITGHTLVVDGGMTLR